MMTEKKTELIEKGFIGIHGQEQFFTQHANKLIDMKSYLFHAPSLHIFVVTTACNGDCVYCQAQSHHTGTGLMMEKETAEKAIVWCYHLHLFILQLNFKVESHY